MKVKILTKVRKSGHENLACVFQQAVEVSLDRSGRVVYAGLELAQDKGVIKEDTCQACRGGSCLICLVELWGWRSEVSVRGFVVLWAGRAQKEPEQGSLRKQRAGLWDSEEPTLCSPVQGAQKEPSSLMSSFGTEKVPREILKLSRSC